MFATKVKICGITSEEDARAAAAAGADAIGMVFYSASPRAVSIDQATAIAAAVGPFVTTVALFVNPEATFVRQVLDSLRPQLLQFHGDEDAAFCQQFAHPYIKAIRVANDTDIAAAALGHPEARGLLFDAWSPSQYGGTGKVFNWHKLAGFEGLPVILAGGLTMENVAQAIATTSPYAVDVSGGVETAPGKKDHDKIRQFIAAVRMAAGQSIIN